MSERLLECVPNFSEGKDERVLDAIARAVDAVPEVFLLHRDRGIAAHRTVFTFAGPPEAVVEAAFRAIAVASERIDMRQHQGAHPRMGACDVCPLIPLEGVTMEEAVRLAGILAERVGRQFDIPVWLYEEAASRPERRNLADLRRGEYEAMAQKLQEREWMPDFGPQRLNPKTGVTAIGARKFLVAYNVNLDTREAALARFIARRIRSKPAPDDSPESRARRLPALKAIGWYIEEFQQVQVSMNLVDIAQTHPYTAFAAVRREAASLEVAVTGSELVGLIPRQALLDSGKAIAHDQEMILEDDNLLIELAARTLRLDQHHPFTLEQRVLEYAYQKARGGLAPG